MSADQSEAAAATAAAAAPSNTVSSSRSASVSALGKRPRGSSPAGSDSSPVNNLIETLVLSVHNGGDVYDEILKCMEDGRPIMSCIKEDLLMDLPNELRLEILSRLPLKSLVTCMAVRHSWLNLVKTREFAEVLISKSEPTLCLAVYQEDAPEPYSVYQIADEERHASTGNCVEMLFSFGFIRNQELHSSVNGLIFLRRKGLCICNPVCRDYLLLPEPDCVTPRDIFGFGVSLTNQYKVLRILLDSKRVATGCELYTLGTGSWRMGPNCLGLRYCSDRAGVCLNGHLYWKAKTSDEHPVIAVFDLETEQFRCFSLHDTDGALVLDSCGSVLGVYKNALCLSDTDCTKNQLVSFEKDPYSSNVWTENIAVPTPPEYDFWVEFPTAVYSSFDTVFVGEVNEAIELRAYRNVPETVPDAVLYPLCTGFWKSCIRYNPSFLACRFFQGENIGRFDE